MSINVPEKLEEMIRENYEVEKVTIEDFKGYISKKFQKIPQSGEYLKIFWQMRKNILMN